MTIDKLSEFASDGQKDVGDLVLTDGFPVTRKPARQWFNWLFNTLTSKINEIIDADFMPKSDVVDNLTTDDATKPVSAKQARLLQDNKLDKTANAASATKLDTSRQVSFSGAATGSFNSDGSADTSCVLTLANSGVTTGTYGSTLKIPVITVNIKGLITTVTTQDIPSASTSAKGLVQLNDTLTSTSTAQALTAAQGKALQDDKLGKNENAVSATNCGRSIVAGNGLGGGGVLNADRTLTLGTPSTITASTGNIVDASSHTHNLDIEGFFQGTKSANGYQRLPGGLILQWGAVDEVDNQGENGKTINFPLAFQAACLNVTLTRKTASPSGDNSDGGIALYATTRTDFSIHYSTYTGSSSGSLRGFTWFAIGY